jgi:Zn-dependent peptidase ImmA (M78 family)/transcriptional regulator with XRE-family HTH domain
MQVPLDREELGRRLKKAREAAGLTQEDVADQLGISRGALAQFETGAKAPNSLHLVRLAETYRRELGELLAEEFDEAGRDPLTALFRADLQLASDRDRASAVAECVKLCREYTNLETLLGMDQDRVYDVNYNTPLMRTRWDAIRQGERLAELERARLRLGEDPLTNLAEILEAQGVRFIELSLSDAISGLFLSDTRYGPSIIVNEEHSPPRRRFSCAHEYCHVLVDRGRGGLVSRAENREELFEVRANAFAAAFLMPEGGVRAFVRRLGKGEQSRSQLRAYDQTAVVEGQRRREAHSQDIQVYDVAHLAHHFGVSYETAVYRLLNLKLVTEEELAGLAQQKEAAASIMRFLGVEPDAKAPGHKPFRHQLVLLAVEALRREVISRAKLRELCDLAQVEPGEFSALLATVEREPETGPKGRRAYGPRA